jgi:parallel beta-helix repeat protein
MKMKIKNYQPVCPPFAGMPSPASANMRTLSILLACLIAMLTPHMLGAAPVTVFSNGFEVGTAGWVANGSTVTRVVSGTGGITSASGANHATFTNSPGGAFTRFGEYRIVFPAGGYTASTKIYLDVAGGWANDTRVDYSVASNQTTNSHRRDFVFNMGFYNAADASGPGAGTDRFVVSGSNSSGRPNSFPKNPDRSPVAIAVSGWYTFEHHFQDNAGVLRVVLNVRDSSDSIVGTWTLSDPTDIIGSTVGGNRYGWLFNNEFSSLAVDDAMLVLGDGSSTPPVFNATQGWYHSTISGAVTGAVSGDVIEVSSGTYVENVTVSKAVDVRGPNWNVSPNTGTRVAEAVIVPSSTNTSTGAVVTLTSSGASFRGFTVDGDNAALAESGFGLGGAHGTSIDAARALFINANDVSGITIAKNIAANAVNGIRLEQTTNYFASGGAAVRSFNILVDDNLVQNITGTGIRLGNSMYAKVTNNTVSNADTGIAFSSFRISDAGNAADRVIQGNTISSRFAGIWTNLFHASPYALVDNTITVAPAATLMAPTPQNRTAWFGIIYSTVSAPQNFTNQTNLPLVVTPERWTATGNEIDGSALESGSTGHGYWFFHVDNNRDSLGVDHFGQILGGSVSNVTFGVMLKNKDADPATSFGNSAVGAHAAVSGVAFSLNAGGTGFRLIDDATWTTANPAPLVNKRNVQLAVGTGNTLTGGAIGAHVTRPMTFAQPDYNPIVGGDLSDLAFSGQTGEYITLVGSPKDLDATSSTFDTVNGATAAESELFDIEDKITHKLDDTALGLVRVKATNVYVSTTGSLERGIAAAEDGDVVNVEGGSPFSLTAEITKNISFSGTFTISSTSIPTDSTATAVLTSFLTRKGTSTATADMTGMNANQVAAVNANFTEFSGFTGAPVSIIRAAAIVGYAPTIQSGIISATAGDVVRVAPGSYTENVLINKNVTLESTGGRAVTTITGVSGVGSLGAVLVTSSTTAVTIGGTGKGFTIVGIDNGDAGLENAAVYFQGGHTGVQVIDNEIQANGDAGLLSEYGAVISGWTIDGNTFSGQTFVGPNPAGNGFGTQFTEANVPRQLVVLGNGGGNLATATATNITFTNNVISGVAGGINISSQEQGNQLVTLDAAASTITGNSFQGTTMRFAGSLRVRRPDTTISGNTFVSTGLGINTSQLFVQNNTTTLQAIAAANTFDKGVYVNNSTTIGLNIQGFIDAVTAGTTIRVLAGTYETDINISKAVTVSGAGAGIAILVGQMGGDGATVRLSATGAVIEGFTITREGNNTTDWNDSTLNVAGVAVQSVDGVVIRNNTIVGNRNGIDINNCSGHDIHNNVIDDNRTGMILRNKTDNLTVTENSISDNWTVGVLFLDASGGSNSPLQTALGCTFTNNKISGNWYGQIVDRQTGGSLPASGTTNLKNFSGNWFGSAAPVVSSANSAEPGYGAQIPLAFGGTAVPPPSSEPDVLGVASANFDITPLLVSGTDTDVETTPGRGTHGFQGNFDSLLVISTLAQDGGGNRIDEARVLANDGALITVESGVALMLVAEITENVTFSGTFAIDSTNIPTDGTSTAVLTSFMTRKGSSPVTVNVLGMNANQLAAVAANLAGFEPFTYPPIVVLSSGIPTGYFTTIQAGATFASAGDVIQVSPGSYTGNVLINKNVTLESTGGRAVTTITGVSGVGSLGAVLVTSSTTAVTIGGTGKGFTIVGIDNGDAGLENAAVYFQGGHTGVQVIDNEIQANGDAGLLSEYGAVISGWTIDGNTFSGQTFVGPNPAGNGFGTQFTEANVPRQLVVLGNGGGNLATATATNITFTNNVISGVAGGINISSQEQGNQLVTLDAAASTITGNSFQGTTMRFAGSLRVRRPDTTISGNTFVSTGLGINTSQLFVQNNTTTLQAIAAANTFDKGVYVNNSTTIGLSIQGFVTGVPSGTQINVLAGTYVENVSAAANSVTLAPGTNTSQIVLDGSLTLDATDALAFNIDGLTAGSNYDQWVINGSVTLGGATLLVSGTHVAANGQSFTLISNDDTDAVGGTFAGLPEDAVITLNGVPLTVTYIGGSNNDVVLFIGREIIVHDGSHGLAPELSDGQLAVVDFGSTAPDIASIRGFFVRNTGDDDLNISSITVPTGFATSGLATVIAPGASYSFQVALMSPTPATYTGNVVINSNDQDEASFEFPVTGTVVSPGTAPVVTIGGEFTGPGGTGSAVLGGPPGSTLTSLIGSPALNSSGVLASAVQIRHADASLHTGMMVGQPMVLIATDTQTAPSLPGVTHFNFGPPVINETGHIAFIGEVRGVGITGNSNSRCLFSNASDGVLKLVARTGTNVGLSSNLKTIGNFAIGGDMVIFRGTLADNSVVLFGWDANTGIRALMRNGQSLFANGVSKTVKSFSVLESNNASSGHGKDISVAPTGESLVSISVTFTDNSSGLVVGSFDGTSDTGFGATYGASQQLADTYASPAVIPLARWSTFRSPGFDNTGNYYGFISQMVTNALAGVNTTNNVGIFVDTAPGNLTLQLRENDVATGTGGLVFSDFSDLVLGGGDYEFLVKGELRGAGVVGNVNDKGLWAQHATNGLVLVAREGSEAPGVAGSTFFRLTQIALPGTAQPMFQASMTNGVGGVTAADDTGLWVINEANEVKLAVREGALINIGGTDRTVSAITALLNGTTTGGALGRRAFLADGQLTLLLTFSGGIQAHAKVVVP